MVGQMWSKWFLILIVHVEKVLGDEYTLSRNKTDLGQSTIPCHINYNEDSTPHNEDSNSFTSYEVLISTPWMIHKGCYYFRPRDKKLKQEHLEYNSPGRCSLFCESFFFRIEKFMQNPEDQDLVDKSCLIAKKINASHVQYKAVSCFEKHTVICFSRKEDMREIDSISKDNVDLMRYCSLFGDSRNEININKWFPDNKYVWTAFMRCKVLIWEDRRQNYKMPSNSSKCQLRGNIQDGSTASLSIQSAENTCFTINLQCNLTIQPMCTVLDAGIDIYEATTTSCEVQQSEITSIKQSTVMTSEVETQSEPNNAEWTSTYNSSSFGSVITLNGGSFLEYIVSTSVVFGILVLIYFAIWICKKVKEANKRKRNVSSPRNNVSHSQPCENVLNSVEYDEVNPAGMVDMTFSQLIDITVIEENNDSETRRNHSYVNQLAQHASISLHDLLPDDNEYEHPYHTLMDNRLSSQHEYSSANTKPEYENTKI